MIRRTFLRALRHEFIGNYPGNGDDRTAQYAQREFGRNFLLALGVFPVVLLLVRRCAQHLAVEIFLVVRVLGGLFLQNRQFRLYGFVVRSDFRRLRQYRTSFGMFSFIVKYSS